MPGKVGVKIKAGRNLPVMDRGSDTTDAYVEIKIGNVTHKTDVCRKTLNPQWNTDWFRFEVDDAELQDEPLQIRLMDHDTYSANDAIGKVNISLNPLCLENAGQSNQGKGAVMSGWIPVFDTMHGIRGEVNIIVKVDLFLDANKFRQSSCGVQFFHSPCIPHGYRAQVIHGFVEELVVNDDPEYQWIDKIRTPRASNEARQVVFLKLSGQVQRKIGLKAINLGANTVIGYAQCFDLEGDVGVVARGIGTAVTLVKIQETNTQTTIDNALIEEQTLKYLEFLKGSPNDWDELSKSIFDTDYMDDKDPKNIVYKILGIEPIDKCSARSPNIIIKRKWKPNSKDGVIVEENFIENETGMRQLLEQEDNRGEKPPRKFHHHVKRITHHSKTLLNEKFNAFKARLNEEKLSENDPKSVNSSWSEDLSFSESARTSLTDLKNLMRFKKTKKLQKYHHQHHKNGGSAMATLLVSSLIRGPSLDSILEARDSAGSSPICKVRTRTNSKSESMTNLSPSNSEENAFLPQKNDIKSESMKNLLSIKPPPPPLLYLKVGENIDNSNSSISGCSSSSTTEENFSYEDDEEEEECSETTTQNEIVVVDPDTVSMVVKTVLAESVQDSDNWIQPGSTHDTISSKSQNLLNKQSSMDSSTSNDKTTSNITCGCSSQQIIPTGATRILKKDKNSHVTESEIIETDTSAEKLELMLKRPSLDDDADNWIEPGSTTDEPELIDKRRRHSSLLHDFRESLTEKFHHLQEHMHLPHFADHSKSTNKHGLLETAMETILVEKVNILGVEADLTQENCTTLPPTSSQLQHQELELFEPNLGKRRNSTELLVKSLYLPLKFDNHTSHENREIINETGMLSNAMNAMLIEPVNIVEEIGNLINLDNNLLEINENFNNNPSNSTVNREFHELKLPNATTLATQCHLKEQSELEEELNNFYSSDPELNQANDNINQQLSPLPFSQPAPFYSLTNLSINNNQKYNENVKSTKKSNTCIIPNAIIIHPSTPLTTSPQSPDSLLFKFDDNSLPPTTNSQSTNHKNINVVIKTIYLVDNIHNNNNCSILNDAKINQKSSSDTNLSFTNKTPMLVPFPCLKKQQPSQLRSSTELVASGSTSPAVISVAASTQSSMSAMTLTVGNVRAMTAAKSDQHMTTDTKTSTTTAAIIHQQGHNRTESVGNNKVSSTSPVKVTNISASTAAVASIPSNNKNGEIFRRSSDSDLSVTPKGNSICVASDRLVAATTMMRLSAPTSLKNTNPDNLDMLEYPFLTLERYPTGFILHLGATVAARSVKLLERVPNPDEPETRDSWWTELRMEIRSHARALGCNVILGYAEVTTISDDVCVLSATGTAAVINMSYSGEASKYDFTTTTTTATTTSSKKDLMVSSLDERECLRDLRSTTTTGNKETTDLNYVTKEFSSSFGGTTKNFPNNFLQNKGCAMCHIPYSTAAIPFNVKMKKCAVCKRGKVPDVLLATIEIPECLQITGRGCFMQAQVVRAKKDLRSESNAKEISDGLPFLEYELHRLLINKLKAKGMNAIFGLKAHVAIGEKMMALIATGTAVFLTALPPPTVPKIVAGNSWHDTARLNDLQKSLQETVERNREIYQLKNPDPDFQQNNSNKQSDTDDSDEELLELDLNAGNKDTCVLEVDDIEDLEIISLLMEPCPPEGFHVVNTQSVPGLMDMEVVRNLQMFTQIWRAKLTVGSSTERFPKHFQRLLQTIYFKLRTMIPCAICDLRFRLDLPESDEIQILVTGMALGLGEPSKLTKLRRKTVSNHPTTDINNFTISNGLHKNSKEEDLMFSLDDDQTFDNSNSNSVIQTTSVINTNFNYGTHSLKLKKNSPCRSKFSSSLRYSRHLPVHDRYGVDITPLSYVPGGRIEKYLGNLNFFFIRESTSIRENGGISGFVHSFVTEILAVVRAHISALGGNAMVSFYMTELLLVDNQHKNQGQCLVSIGGDVVSVSYYADD